MTISLNACAALRRTIECVNGQTYSNLEHVLVDGGSRDGSAELIAQLPNREPLRICEPDRGISDAFNKGTRAATGDYVCYLNAGDLFATSQVVEHAAQTIAAGEPGIYFGDFISIDGAVPRRHVTSCAVEDFAWDNPINHQSAFIPRGLALAYPYDPRLTLGMDYDFWLRVLGRARFCKLPFVVARFELGGRSNSPRWAVHGMVMHRVLWHLNRGSRFTAADLAGLLTRTVRLKSNILLHRLLGRRTSLVLRAAKSRWQERVRPPRQSFA